MQQVVTAVRRVNGLLVDIRYAPGSKRPGFNAEDFRREMGRDYVWMRYLGNKNFRGGDIELVDFEKGVKMIDTLLEDGRPVVLMCACGRPDHCHRKVVGQLLQNIGFDVAELAYEPDPPKPQAPAWSQDPLF
jgi:uncharacterized protein (DUF488 family)